MTPAKDLTQQPPRSPKTRLGGYVVLARMIDKGRAVLAGTLGEFHFDCPLDRYLLDFKGVKADDVKNLLASGASDEEVVAWFGEQGAKKTPAEIAAWASGMEALSFYNDPSPERQAYFRGECAKLGLDPAKASVFDWLDADDAASFKK